MSGKKDLPYDLENMSIPDLEALLQQDFIATNGSAPDIDYIMAIMEVIQKKEQAQPDHRPPDTESAWEEFQSFYNTEEGRANSIHRSVEEDDISKAAGHALKHQKPKAFRRYLMVAVLAAVLVAVTMIPVSGYTNVIQMLIAHWTNDYFFFLPDGKEPKAILDNDATSIPNEFIDLYDALVKNGTEKIAIPRYIPEELEVDNSVLYISSKTGAVDFSIHYQSSSDSLLIKIKQNQSSYQNIAEKDNETVEKLFVDGTEYQFFSNNNVNTVAWNTEGVQCVITSSLPVSDLKEIIHSIQF
ncbi:hypothetical protein N510_003280 [Firmicutes bacterium ASF500]|nr:hypothetical protein N510_003280 [Firmicutes bacterium ASF500]